jgi:hypothetical protein
MLDKQILFSLLKKLETMNKIIQTMRASLSYHYQKITSSFIILSAFIFAVSYFVIPSSSLQTTSLILPIRIVALIIFVFCFGIYSYLRAITLFGDYVKSGVLRSIISNIILFVNLFTCTSALVALIYIHFLSLISFIQ